MTTSIKPLSNSQKLFLQRLLVSHILTDNEARDLYNNIRTQFANIVPDEEDNDGPDPSYMGNSFDHNLGLINASLLPAFNLEICTLLLPPPYNPDDTPNNNASLIKYHAIVNKSNDGIAKSHGASSSIYGPHELAYLRLLLEKLVEHDNANNKSNHKGCMGIMNKMDIINTRNYLEGAHANKLSLASTESALEVFITEKWLVEMAPPGDDDSDDEDQEEEEERRKKKKRKSSGRKSLKGTYYGIGPRSFLELGEFLVGVGMEEERMPQTIINRP
ncbi:hypothetical protein ACHAWO_011624 [Cyclotella atomus]|uniref:Non-structural maintenance of chromosomes element 1 homolog n=1 Tax=Cyclotella atomus TaxID=382360 RepID=A0ABD3NCU1_9STRA